MHNTQSRLPVNDNDVVTSIATIGTFEAVVFFLYQLPRRCSWHVYVPNIQSLFFWNDMHCYNRVEPQLLEDQSQLPHSFEARPIVFCSCSYVFPRDEWKNGHFFWRSSLRPQLKEGVYAYEVYEWILGYAEAVWYHELADFIIYIYNFLFE